MIFYNRIGGLIYVVALPLGFIIFLVSRSEAVAATTALILAAAADFIYRLANNKSQGGWPRFIDLKSGGYFGLPIPLWAFSLIVVGLLHMIGF